MYWVSVHKIPPCDAWRPWVMRLNAAISDALSFEIFPPYFCLVFCVQVDASRFLFFAFFRRAILSGSAVLVIVKTGNRNHTSTFLFRSRIHSIGFVSRINIDFQNPKIDSRTVAARQMYLPTAFFSPICILLMCCF